MTTVFEPHPKIHVGFTAQHEMADSIPVKVSAEPSSSTMSTSSSVEKITAEIAHAPENELDTAAAPAQEEQEVSADAESHPHLHSFQLPIDLDVM
ncbi:hypothetical protein Y032_0013g2111 [Ancylostoma ceylanicum]|uniref:Uncharacterized protein n=1 Tax=Ancylostoma ceylanicum TaxID=53326 RepID=A0A016VCL9_9BILA|nr:hypothetical protein Y032_0013g2111 [Ancylostoma ceylanicum]